MAAAGTLPRRPSDGPTVSPTVRRYEGGDAGAVWRVHERPLRASPLPFVPDAPADEDLRNVRERYLDGGGDFLVGTVDGAVVATGGFLPRDDATVELRRIRVDPDRQRRGHGRRLLDALERRARGRGFGAAVLETRACLTAARRLYESAGYEETGREDHPPTGGTVLCYRRSL